MSNFNDERIAQAKARCEAATEGPWEAMEDDAIAANVTRTHLPNGGARVSATWIANVDMENRHDYTDELESATAECDKLFIAHARQDLPDAIAEIEALRARVAELDGALREAVSGSWRLPDAFEAKGLLLDDNIVVRDMDSGLHTQYAPNLAKWLREQEGEKNE